MPSQSRTEFLEVAKKRWQVGRDADANQRKREREDLKNYSGDTWSKDDVTARSASPAGLGIPPMPARPMMKIPLLREPIKQVTNQERQSELGVELVPADDFAGLVGSYDQSEIELREGLVRRLQRESEAADARTWAFDRAVKCGRGFYYVTTRYLPGKTWDQEVAIERIFNQESVTLDPAHEQPDGSDCEWEFITNDYVPFEVYRKTWRKNVDGESNPITTETFQSFQDGDPNWFKTEGDLKYVRVTDYYYKEYEERTLVQLADGQTAWKDEIDPKVKVIDERTVLEPSVKWCKLDGIQILEETDWPSPHLPIVKILAEEMQPYDGERRAEGMVRPAADSNMGFNAMLSKGVELIGLAPIPPLMIAEGQVEGYEAWYQAASTRTLPYLPYKTKDLEGNVVGAPQRTPVDTPIAAVATFMQVFRDTLQSTTLVHDPTLGRASSDVKSGKMVALLQQQSQHGTSGFLDNFKRSVRYEGKIVNSLLEPVYGRRPGRLTRILSKEGEPQQAFINGMPPDVQPTQGQPMPKEYRLTPDCSCNIIIKVSRNFDSRRTEISNQLGELIAANPLFMTWFGDLFLDSLDWPNHQALAERAKVMLDPAIQQMMQAKQQGQQPVDPQVQQLQMRLKEAEGLLQQAAQEVKSKERETEAKLQIAQLEYQQAIELRKMQDATAIAVAHIQAASKGLAIDAHAAEEELALGVEMAERDKDRAHEAELAAHGSLQETATEALLQAGKEREGQLSRDHEAAMSEREREAAKEEAEKEPV